LSEDCAQDVDAPKDEIVHLNEHIPGDPRMFKISGDPRTTRVGGFLRVYSLDEFHSL